MAGRPRSECIIASDEVWAAAIADYLAGMSAPAAAEKHGVRVSGLRGRIHKAGVSKSKQARLSAVAAGRSLPAPPGALIASLDPESLTSVGVRRAALASASAALNAGRPKEAVEIVQALEPVLELAEAVEIAEAETALDVALGLLTDDTADIPPALLAYVEDLAERLIAGEDFGPVHAPWAERWRAQHLGEAV